MPWKISKIEIKNFKFFRDFTLDTDRNNVLLYGENGSGKSSIYWSVFTHFQACYKNREQAQKYFQVDHAENLRNRYSQTDEPSMIKISFDNGQGGTYTVEDSASNYYSENPAIARFMKWTAMSSDFMNYKFLFSLFDFPNSKENEIFRILEKEALPFFDLDEGLVDIDGVELNTNNAGDWWNYIKETCNPRGPIPRKRGSSDNYIQHSNEYKRAKEIIEDFNRLLHSKLALLIYRANSIIQQTFKMKAQLLLEYTNAEFNRKIMSRVFDGKLHAPKVVLKVQLQSESLTNTDPIIHFRSFFNEAKITCMALALRLAILESHPTSDDCASILFIDDLLISLDMPLRRKVIDILLPYASNYQMFILTHDRAFYHLVASEQKLLGVENNWKKCELYIEEENGLETSVLFSGEDKLEKAKKLLRQHEISASVNAVRQATEKVLKNLLPQNIIMDTSELGKSPLTCLIDHFHYIAKEANLPNIAAHIQDERKLLLNPFSHDDIETPFYKRELESIIKEIEELNKITRTKIIDYSAVRTEEFLFKMNNPSNEMNFEGKIIFLETMSEYEYNGHQYFQSSKIKLSTSNDRHIVCKDWGLYKLYNKVANYLVLSTQDRPPLQDCLYKINGDKLIEN